MFNKINNLDELRKAYRAAAFAAHPDHGGSVTPNNTKSTCFRGLLCIWRQIKQPFRDNKSVIFIPIQCPAVRSFPYAFNIIRGFLLTYKNRMSVIR